MQNADFTVLKTDFDGQVILPGDEEYETASKTLFADGKPAVIVKPQNAQSVARAVNFARDNSLEISLRSGGHSGAGFSTNNGGMVIDVSSINNVDFIDREKNTVRVGTGARWGDVAKALGAHGLSISSGDTKSVGVAGLTLGAGIGWMVRKYGLAIDCLVGAEIVTADGEILRASAEEHPDLFWAIRGGGGNFGVVTQLEFAAHKTGQVLFGNIVFERTDLAGLLKGWRDVMREAPAELTTTFLVMPEMMGNPASAMIICCYDGTDRSALAPLLKLGKVVHENVAVKAYPEVLEDAHVPQGVRVITHNVFISELSDEAAETIAHEADQHHMILQIRSVSGALNKVPVGATAFAHRHSEVLVVSPVFVSPAASKEELSDILAPWGKIAAFGDGAYINFFTEPDEEVVSLSYPPETLERLAQVKKTYDPQNIFHHNFNILPAQD